MKRVLKDNGLFIAMASIFLVMLGGQVLSGWHVYNADEAEHGEKVIGLLAYLNTGHFGEAIFENWESEFFQMLAYVALTARLFQSGSPESKACTRKTTSMRIHSSIAMMQRRQP